MQNERKHLSVFGIGPVYGTLVIGLTIAGVFLKELPILKSGTVDTLFIPFVIIGTLFIMTAAAVFIKAQLDISDNIEKNHLVTTGIYAHCRNPLYTAVMYACIGADFVFCNLWLLILPFVYWLLMTVLVRATEEKWLAALYGEEYVEYCKRVNRCILWFKRK